MEVQLLVVVHIDANHRELWDALWRFCNRGSFVDIVRCEVQSNLESVPYVRRVTVTTTQPKGGES